MGKKPGVYDGIKHVMILGIFTQLRRVFYVTLGEREKLLRIYLGRSV